MGFRWLLQYGKSVDRRRPGSDSVPGLLQDGECLWSGPGVRVGYDSFSNIMID